MKNNQKVRGHTLVWYAHHPDWINNNYFSKEELKAILKNIYKQWLSVTKEEYTLGML
ncbi:endo-1,4-beta-xylanase [Metabacillus litoralis]|nr:endo-1,4-beta-xylanase [Metabacillus litoralis]